MKKIYRWEPWFFLFFGIFHLHRIWALIDRESYASFWLGVMKSKGLIYFLLMGILSVLCILGIVTFFRERGKNYWWRWIYICGGDYLLFDLFAIEVIVLEYYLGILYSVRWFCICNRHFPVDQGPEGPAEQELTDRGMKKSMKNSIKRT